MSKNITKLLQNIGNKNILIYNIFLYREKVVYVNYFLKQKRIPNDLRSKINRYLEYNYEQKVKIKIEEEEIKSLLNKELRNKLII